MILNFIELKKNKKKKKITYGAMKHLFGRWILKLGDQRFKVVWSKKWSPKQIIFFNSGS